MISELHSVHTIILNPMADSSNTEKSASAPIFTPPVHSHTAPHIVENAAAPLSIPNIHSHIAPKVQFDEQNYMTWVFQFRPILRTNDLMGIVDGSEPCPPKFIPGLTVDSPAQLNPAFTL
jgi:hypothetical protein